MPENHRQYLSYTREDFLSWASSVGPNAEKVVRFFLESGRAPEQGFKSCVSLKRQAERYKPERIEEACRQVLLFSGEPSVRSIGVLLKTPLSNPGSESSPASRPVHRSRGITRGADQFRSGGGHND